MTASQLGLARRTVDVSSNRKQRADPNGAGLACIEAGHACVHKAEACSLVLVPSGGVFDLARRPVVDFDLHVVR